MIYDTVFRYLPIFLTVLRYWVLGTPIVPLLECNLGAHLINMLISISLKVFMSTLIYSLQNVYPTVDLAEARGDAYKYYKRAFLFW